MNAGEPVKGEQEGGTSWRASGDCLLLALEQSNRKGDEAQRDCLAPHPLGLWDSRGQQEENGGAVPQREMSLLQAWAPGTVGTVRWALTPAAGQEQGSAQTGRAFGGTRPCTRVATSALQ